mgnify:FL=1
MEKVGKNDWRMYREKLKMLGVNDNQEFQHKIIEEAGISDTLDTLEESDYEDLNLNIAKVLGSIKTQTAPSRVLSSHEQV